MALKQKDAPATGPDRSPSHSTGAGVYTVKHKRATSRQRENIDAMLGQAQEDGASRRVMIAAVMAATQESRMGEDGHKTGNDDTGFLQQGRNWISESGSKDAAKATHAFLVTGPTAWKKVHHGLKNAPGDLNAAIMAVQGSVGGYGQWEEEATKTVDRWRSEGGADAGTYIKRYVFTRGEKGGSREDSWDAAERLVQEVGGYRWAAGNVFYAVSGDELRRGGPSMMIRGDEGWLRGEPSWTWASRRSVGEITLPVLLDRWDVMPGGMVELHRDYGAMSGKWMVANVSGDSLASPEAEIVLHRPTELKPEPASERSDAKDGDGSGGDLRSIAKDISDHRHEYVYGGSHGPKVKTLKETSAFDCSSSVSYLLYRGGFFDGDRPAYTSGIFAAKWGRAGKGDEFTVWANATHVWLEFADGARFDTSQHGGKSGPAFTEKKRTDQGRFTPRHLHGH